MPLLLISTIISAHIEESTEPSETTNPTIVKRVVTPSPKDTKDNTESIVSEPTAQNVDNVDLEEFNFADFGISEEQLEQMKSAVSVMMDTMIIKLTTQLKDVDNILEDLALSTNNNAFGTKNKQKLLEQIKSVRRIITNVQKNSFIEINPIVLQDLTSFTSLLIDHVGESVKGGFKDLPSFEEKLPLLQRRSIEGIDIEQIQDKIAKNEELIAKLTVDAQEIGLTWYNKIFRKISNLAIIAHRRKWDRNLLGASVLGSIGAHCIMKYTKFGYNPADILRLKAAKLETARKTFNESSFQEAGKQIEMSLEKARLIEQKEEIQGISLPDKCARSIRWALGMPPIEENGELAEGAIASEWNRTKVNWFGKTDLTVKTMGAILLGAYVPVIRFVYGANWAKRFGGWVGKGLMKVYGKLIGGTAGKQTIRDQDDSGQFEPRYTFDDVVGFDHIKAMLWNVLEYIKNPERFDRANIPPEHGYLFTGLPGTGKSFVAEAFGGEIRKIFKEIGRNKDELGFYSFKAGDLNETGLGLLLECARNEAPCVIFIDEIDLLRLQRAKGNSVLLSEFLSSLSGVLSKDSGKQIVVLAATNRPEHLDKALRRRGRLGKIIHFELPTVAERKQFFVKKLSPLLPDLNKIDIDKLAEDTEGRTYEELAVLINSAFQRTKISGQTLTQKHLEDALDEELRSIVNKNINISEQEQNLIAAHQAGHALAIELLELRRELSAVTIKPRLADLQDESYAQYYAKRKQKDVEYGRTFTKCSFDHLEIYSREEKIKECKVLLAGIVAERILFGSCGHSYGTNNKQKALNLIKSLVFEGLHVKTMPKKIQLEYFQKALALLKQCEEEIEELLVKHKTKLQAIADSLQKYKTLSAKRVKEILASCDQPTSPDQQVSSQEVPVPA